MSILEKSDKNEKKELTPMKERKKRIPLGIPRKKLDFPVREGYVRRIINDVPGRLENAQNAGYEFVTDPSLKGSGDVKMAEGQDSRVTRVVGSSGDNKPVLGYLMEIPEEWYNEDQEEKMNKIDKMEDGMRQGIDDQGHPGDKEGRYIPSTGISIPSMKRG